MQPPNKKGGERIKKILTYSPVEVIQLLKQGYRLDSMGYFPNGSGASYTLVKNQPNSFLAPILWGLYGRNKK